MRWINGFSYLFLALCGLVGSVSCDHRSSSAGNRAPSQVTIGVDAKGQCYYSTAATVKPKELDCDKIKACLDNHIDPASDACSSK